MEVTVYFCFISVSFAAGIEDRIRIRQNRFSYGLLCLCYAIAMQENCQLLMTAPILIWYIYLGPSITYLQVHSHADMLRSPKQVLISLWKHWPASWKLLVNTFDTFHMLTDEGPGLHSFPYLFRAIHIVCPAEMH